MSLPSFLLGLVLLSHVGDSLLAAESRDEVPDFRLLAPDLEDRGGDTPTHLGSELVLGTEVRVHQLEHDALEEISEEIETLAVLAELTLEPVFLRQGFPVLRRVDLRPSAQVAAVLGRGDGAPLRRPLPFEHVDQSCQLVVFGHLGRDELARETEHVSDVATRLLLELHLLVLQLVCVLPLGPPELTFGVLDPPLPPRAHPRVVDEHGDSQRHDEPEAELDVATAKPSQHPQ